ncbi:MAG: hypothetical protein NT018_00915 [Armatimonadetes bacterium]|nr:hypothetical protein [Armatimonadota bacterium]
MKYLFLVILLLFVVSCAFADDIVTMPTANQLKAGELDAAVYYLNLDTPAGAPQFVQMQTLYYGLTDKLELDIHRSAIDNVKTSTILVGSYKLLSESPTTPDLVVGCRNIGGAATLPDAPGISNKTRDRSYFLAAAKTFFFNPEQPGPPLVRVHLGIGTEDWTLLGEKRHDGIFGGLQFLLRPELGLVVEHDGQDLITGITIMPKNSGLTIKGGMFGDHTWVGIAYRAELSK